jgi:hypothetical protein
MISLAIVTSVVLMMSLIFSNILSSNKNINKIKAQELIDQYISEGAIGNDELYDLDIKIEPSPDWNGLDVLTYTVFYRDRLILVQRKIVQ